MVNNLNILYNLIEQVLKHFNFECEKTTQEKIKNYSETVEEHVKKHLMTNDCIAKEICGRISTFSDDFLANELKTYVKAFKESIDEDRFFRNQKIKDEIDESVYDVIEAMLGEKNIKNGKCIANYLQRSNVVDKFFTLDMLMNERKLWSYIESHVQSYQRLFNN
jgi:gas vesicle protein